MSVLQARSQKFTTGGGSLLLAPNMLATFFSVITAWSSPF